MADASGTNVPQVSVDSSSSRAEWISMIYTAVLLAGLAGWSVVLWGALKLLLRG